MSQTEMLTTGIADQPQSACFNVEDRLRGCCPLRYLLCNKQVSTAIGQIGGPIGEGSFELSHFSTSQSFCRERRTNRITALKKYP